ncbi:DUF1428 domain-containing protein [Oricola sp.]|uniref:DUF1428 domain-containing protein n=1 Tax=Oricola sp. TaxID=1979950 RepID=UPI003BAA44CF
MAYVDGVVFAVANARKDEFVAHAKRLAALFKRHGATEVVDCWGTDVPDGDVTSFPMAVKKADDETVVFSWIVWPSKQARDTAWDTVMADAEMNTAMEVMPFDGKRMIYGGFEVVSS